MATEVLGMAQSLAKQSGFGRAVFGISVATLIATAPAHAHHGWGSYDSTQLLTLTGAVEEPSFNNPHASIRLTDSAGLRFIVLAPPSRMTSRGLPAALLKAGQTVTVQGYPHKTDPQELRAERITIDGKTVELR
jgi:hypothetical protein